MSCFFYIVNYSGVFGIPERVLEYAKRAAYHQELHVAAEKLKIRHDMERKYVEGKEITIC